MNHALHGFILIVAIYVTKSMPQCGFAVDVVKVIIASWCMYSHPLSYGICAYNVLIPVLQLESTAINEGSVLFQWLDPTPSC